MTEAGHIPVNRLSPSGLMKQSLVRLFNPLSIFSRPRLVADPKNSTRQSFHAHERLCKLAR